MDIPINDELFSGLALGPHLCIDPVTRSTTRTPLGELFYTYRYRGGDGMEKIARLLAQAIGRMHIDTKALSLLFMPPAPGQADYERIIRLSVRVVSLVGAASAQPAIVRDTERNSELKKAKFSVNHRVAEAVIKERPVLIMDDIFRTGRTLRTLSALLHSLGAASILVLVGTIVDAGAARSA